MYSKFDNCVEHPLGILCKCTDYQEILNKFTSYNIGTEHYLKPKVNVEPIASAKVLWINNRLKLDEDISKPILLYPQEQLNITAYNVDKIWMPTVSNLIPLKFIFKL
ncbi:uncharacterized protein LOC122712861 [Apis laboriosa]|uniref:uncharacterized protein LOC122712861 n=1 Tax=Apis laboriosa TaxID=183418 RepID=UPI001CC7F94A|nr:uncharacterized protein LOC122712861 [Apis laboriosa]